MKAIRVEIASLSGEREFCEIELTKNIVPVILVFRSKQFGELTFAKDNFFDALLDCRRLLEKKGYLMLCNGARKDAYPSGMALEMGLGMSIYLFQTSKGGRRGNLVDIFGAATIEQVCTVDEQRAAYDAWLKSFKKYVYIEIASPSGEREPCKIEYALGIDLVTLDFISLKFGELSFVSNNIFDAMSDCRRRLEKKGYRTLCNGARKDVYPSQTGSRMNLARGAYLLHFGKKSTREDWVDIFDPATIDQVCTVDEQYAAYEAWARSLK